jgi:tetratricopeptide (TPR) repeat protein
MVVPSTVRSVLLRRIESLADTTQQVLMDASVLGQRFGFDELVVLSQRDGEMVERALEEAQRIGLVRETGIDRYAFNHALTQHALLAELSGRRRRRLHGDSGRALEALPARERERRAGELAWHFREAGELERALVYTLQAGDYDEQVFAHEEAECHYRRALQLARQQSDRGREREAMEKLGRTLTATARFGEALEVLERATELYRADGDREGEARATAAIADALIGKGRTGEAVARLERMLAAFEGAGASPGHARLYSSLAAHLFFAGRYEDMLTTADRAGELARAVGDESIPAEARHFQGTALMMLGRIDDARGVLEEAVELLERVGAVRRLRSALGNLGETYLILGAFEQTRHLWERVLLLAEQVGDPQGITFASANRSEISFYLGDWPAARGYAERAAGILEGADPAWPTAYPPLFLGIVALAEGRWEEGDRHLAACLALAEQHENLQAIREAHRWLAERDLMEGRAKDALARLEPLLDRPGLEEQQVTRLLPCLGSAYLELGEVDRAEETVMTGRERAARQSHRLALVDLLRVQGVLRSRQGRRAEAEHAFGDAVSLARSMPYPYAEARALYEWGRMQGAKEEPLLAQSRLEDAGAIFRRLGARPHIERMQQALAALEREVRSERTAPRDADGQLG